MADRYIEIFEERKDNGKSKLSYYGYDGKMHDVGEADIDALKKVVEDLWSVSTADVADPEWVDTSYTIRCNLTSLTSDNPKKRIKKGEPYEAILTTSNSSKTVNITVLTMGGDSIAATAVSSVTGATNKKKISIAAVTGDVVITAAQST